VIRDYCKKCHLIFGLFVKVISEDIIDQPVVYPGSQDGPFAGIFKNDLSHSGQLILKDPGSIVGLFGKGPGLKDPGHDLKGTLTQLLGFCVENNQHPSPWFHDTFYVFRHVFRKGRIPMFAIISFVCCDPLHPKIDFNFITVIDDLNLFANELIGNTVLVPVFSEDHMVILLNLGHNGMFEDKRLIGKGFKKRLFFLSKTI